MQYFKINNVLELKSVRSCYVSANNKICNPKCHDNNITIVVGEINFKEL